MKPLPSVETIRDLVRSMKPLAKRKYEPQYLCEEDILGHYLEFFCDICPEIVEEADINTAHCPCEFDATDVDCVYSYKYDRIKDAIVLADMILRAELGDHWGDDYSRKLTEVCIWVS